MHTVMKIMFLLKLLHIALKQEAVNKPWQDGYRVAGSSYLTHCFFENGHLASSNLSMEYR